MMNGALHRAFLTRLLAATNGESLTVEALRGSMRVTSEAFDALLDTYCAEGLITLREGSIELTLEQRLDLSMKAVELGADFEAVSRGLGWLEFEEVSAKVLEANGFSVKRRFRFTAEGRRWEIDLLAARAPYLVCAECKHWGRGIGNSTARDITETHLAKVEVFSKHLEELRDRVGVDAWSRAIIIPMVLTLSSTPMEIYQRVPSVSVLSLPRFIDEFDGQLERLANFRVELPERERNKEVKKKISGSKRPRRRL
jgi:Holliday junction resolvase-like predicted endonuclease